ncbi:hypothetical protein, partial [Aerolutibacter daejeonensis]|uniref:hypothetical protein n=1 Tax=Aerolutibacter daejeonensis TaxID=346181 RepID=UPI001E5F73A4
MNRTREEKLSPALHLARDLADLRMKLLSYQQPHTRLAEWLEDAIVRINRATNEKRWLPIWWRYGTIDANASGGF